MKNITRIFKISKPLHKVLYFILFLTLLNGILQQATPLLSRQIVNEIQKQLETQDGSIERLYLLIGLTFIAGLFGIFIDSVLQRSGDYFGARIRKFLTELFYDHIFRLPQSYFDTEISGKIVNQLNRGILSVEQFMKTASNFIFPTFLQTIFTISLMLYFSWPVALFIILLFPIYTVISYYSSKKWGEEEVKKNKYEDITRGRIQEVMSNMKLVKGFSNQKNEYNFISKQLNKIISIYDRQSSTFHVYDFARKFSLNIILLLVNLVIFYNTFEGKYSIGDMVLLIQLTFQIQRPLFVMSFILTQIQTTEAGTKEFFEILDLKAEESYEVKSKFRKDKIKSIKFDKVEFSYEKGDSVLKKVSLEIKENEKIALVGHSGAGKSTIINLITKLYTPTGGEIYMDGEKYSELTHNDVRSNISLVFQENELFSTTIRENISYGKKSTDKEIEAALRGANAWEFVSKLKKGVDTEVGERGIRLSGGQKQRIQIARAILHNAPVVILDEATSNLDSKSEHEVQDALETLMKGRIVIIIAHRLSTIQNVDRIFVIDDGKIADSGSPKELSTRDGVYQSLLRYQIEGDKKLLANFELY